MLRRSDRHGSERKHCSEIEERGGGGRWAGERLGVCRRTLVSSAAASMCSEALRNSSFRRTVGGGAMWIPPLGFFENALFVRNPH